MGDEEQARATEGRPAGAARSGARGSREPGVRPVPAKAPIGDFKDLLAWRQAYDVTRAVYQVTRERYRPEWVPLIRQLQRSSLSVPSNIAEGYGRGSLHDYIRFLRMARGSAAELETQLLLAKDLGLLEEGTAAALLRDLGTVQRLLGGLLRSLGG
jgi:four helix bundle protein